LIWSTCEQTSVASFYSIKKVFSRCPPVFSPVRCPRLASYQVAQTLDLGDGKTQKIFERITVTPPPEHAPPIKLSGPVGKITSNIYFYASMNKCLDAVEKDFKTIESTLLNTKEWLNSNGLTFEGKVTWIKGYTGKASLSPFTKQLLEYFVEQKLLKHLPEIKNQFLQLIREKRGEIDVFVTSAEPLPADTLKTLEGLIIKQIGSSAASKVNFKTEVDKDLVAGLRIRYKSTLIDNTVARKVGAVKDVWAKAYAESLAL
jgi:ATP synthase F1 delta subunit